MPTMNESQPSSVSQNDLNIEQQNINNNTNNNNKNHFICGVVEGFYGKPWTFCQRKDLFKRLREFNLNAFMYAPKDDTKHRAKWRQLYNEAESQELKILIDEAEANGIDFYYSIAPGLDMVYSSQEEQELLRRKLDQLRSLGCKSFAILFDDIEPNVTSEKDRVIYKDNYASAQVFITNLIYDYLGRPKFMFCPTEYCESRAIPTVPDSLYLNTIGTGLHNDIDIMWSGPRVVSRYITEESIKQLNSVLRRPAVIWENLHANDYDKKRVYLGPYSGRSTKIIPQLRGVLTNPNCEYEANYVAIHTLAQWSKCTKDINPSNRCNQEKASPYSGDITVQQMGGTQQGHLVDPDFDNDSVYDPDRALVRAIRDWLPHVLSQRSLPHGCDISTPNEHPQDDQTAASSHKVDLDSLALLVDLFYLPFEHGFRGHALLKDISWLIDNSSIFEPIIDDDDSPPRDSSEKSIEDDAVMDDDETPEKVSMRADSKLVEQWAERAEKLRNFCTCIQRILDTMIYDCPNKLLVIELYPYLMELRDVISMIKDYINFLRHRKTSLDRTKQKEFVSCDEQEPWVHRGGLIGDVQRLIS